MMDKRRNAGLYYHSTRSDAPRDRKCADCAHVWTPSRSMDDWWCPACESEAVSYAPQIRTNPKEQNDEQ